MSNAGMWDGWSATLGVDDPEASGIRYGDGITYLMAAAFLADMTEVEAWGRSFACTDIKR